MHWQIIECVYLAFMVLQNVIFHFQNLLGSAGVTSYCVALT